MLNFVSKVYGACLELILWLVLIGCAIAGGCIADNLLGLNGWLGFILGAIAGLIFNIVFGGALATIADTNKKVSKLEDSRFELLLSKIDERAEPRQ